MILDGQFIVLHHGCFPGNYPKFAEQLFSYLCTAAPVIGLYLHCHLHILPIHIHLNHIKSHHCSQVYFLSDNYDLLLDNRIYCIALLLLLCLRWRSEIMYTDNADFI